jgi:hypothetical protein
MRYGTIMTVSRRTAGIARISISMLRAEKISVMRSPGFTSFAGRTARPLTSALPELHSSCATALRLTRRLVFRYRSRRTIKVYRKTKDMTTLLLVEDKCKSHVLPRRTGEICATKIRIGIDCAFFKGKSEPYFFHKRAASCTSSVAKSPSKPADNTYSNRSASSTSLFICSSRLFECLIMRTGSLPPTALIRAIKSRWEPENCFAQGEASTYRKSSAS